MLSGYSDKSAAFVLSARLLSATDMSCLRGAFRVAAARNDDAPPLEVGIGHVGVDALGKAAVPE